MKKRTLTLWLMSSALLLNLSVGTASVSYTHLDVYKRQVIERSHDKNFRR